MVAFGQGNPFDTSGKRPAFVDGDGWQHSSEMELDVAASSDNIGDTDCPVTAADLKRIIDEVCDKLGVKPETEEELQTACTMIQGRVRQLLFAMNHYHNDVIVKMVEASPGVFEYDIKVQVNSG